MTKQSQWKGVVIMSEQDERLVRMETKLDDLHEYFFRWTDKHDTLHTPHWGRVIPIALRCSDWDHYLICLFCK